MVCVFVYTCCAMKNKGKRDLFFEKICSGSNCKVETTYIDLTTAFYVVVMGLFLSEYGT